MSTRQHQLTIARHLRTYRAVAKNACHSGMITVLRDEDGDSLPVYLDAFAGEKTEDRVEITLDKRPLHEGEMRLLGFGERLPEESSIQEFLASCGVPDEEVPQVVTKLDLESQSYLSCAQLNATAARQLQLFALLRSDAKALVVYDPFQPFNGRWREYFAERLLQDARQRQRIIIVLQLSFVPKCWEKLPEVRQYEVGRAARKAEEKARKRAELEAERAKQKALQGDDIDKAVSDLAALDGLPQPLVFAYKATHDWLFAPLARLSNTLRSFSGASTAIGGVAVLVVIAAMAYPNLPYFQEKIRQLVKPISGTEVVAYTEKTLSKARKPPVLTKQASKEGIEKKNVKPIDKSEGLPETKAIEQKIAIESIPDPFEESLPDIFPFDLPIELEQPPLTLDEVLALSAPDVQREDVDSSACVFPAL